MSCYNNVCPTSVLTAHLRILNFLLGQVDIAGQLPDLHAIGFQALAKVAHHLRNQCLWPRPW